MPTNYSFIVSFLDPSGANYGTLAPHLEALCYQIAAGDAWRLYDWSFIRDADDRQLDQIAAVIRTTL
tara:strand:+ start:644 stop:844 length:201 start_codon:yes stop_codon:yes gene_type:complete